MNTAKVARAILQSGGFISERLLKARFTTAIGNRLSEMERNGLVQFTTNYAGERFVMLTPKGFDWYKTTPDAKRFCRNLKSYITAQIRWRSVFSQEFLARTFTKFELIESLGASCKPQLIQLAARQHFLTRMYPEFKYVQRQRPWIESLIKRASKLFGYDADEIFQKGREKGERYVEAELAIKAEKNKAPLAYCYFCGAPIRVKSAVQDAQLIEKFTGQKSAPVCCVCYSHLQFVEKHLIPPERR